MTTPTTANQFSISGVTANLLPIIGPGYRKEHLDIPVDKLEVDANYQRDPIPRHVTKIQSHFNPILFGELTVCEVRTLSPQGEEESHFYIADGQHRWLAAQKLRMKTVPCVVYYGLTQTEIAEMFDGMNEGRIKTTPFDHHKAKLFQKKPDAMAIQEILNHEKLILVASQKKTNRPTYNTSACGTIYEIYNAWGYKILQESIHFCTTTWPGDADALVSLMFYGAAYYYDFLDTHYRDKRDSILAATSKKIRNSNRPARDLMQEAARHGHPGAHRGTRSDGPLLAEVFIYEYNRGKREGNLLDRFLLGQKASVHSGAGSFELSED